MSTLKKGIALIGPAKSGKSTIGRLLAERLDVPFQTFDLLTLGLKHADSDTEDTIRALEGVTAWYRYLLPFAVDALESACENVDGGVVEISRWYGDPADTDLFDRVKRLLSTFELVVMTMPSDDPDFAFDVLRNRWKTKIDGVELNRHFATHDSNRRIAKHVVYTKGKTPLETRDEVLAAIDPEASPIILIGPIRAGKSTQGRLLAEALGRKQLPMDAVRWTYYKEIGWTSEAQAEISKSEGFAGVYRYWKQFEIHAVERVIDEHRDCVIDFGAGHSVYEDPALLDRALAALAPVANIVLLMPSEDVAETLGILDDRDTILIDGIASNRYILSSKEYMSIASMLSLTAGLTPEELAESILSHHSHS